MIVQRKYGEAAIIQGVPIIERGAQDFIEEPAFEHGDVWVLKDGVALQINGIVPGDLGNYIDVQGSFHVRIRLTAAQMTCKQIAVRFRDQSNPKTFEDQLVLVETYGHVNAQHTFNPALLDVAVGSRLAADTYAAPPSVASILAGLKREAFDGEEFETEVE